MIKVREKVGRIGVFYVILSVDYAFYLKGR